MQELLDEKLAGIEIGPDTAAKISLLPITQIEAANIRAHVQSVQISVARTHEQATKADSRSQEAIEIATIADRKTASIAEFSDRILKLESAIQKLLSAKKSKRKK